MPETLPHLLDFAHELAWQAGKITLRHFQTGIHADLKADESPVTVADREAEQYLRAAIAARYPDHAVLGEEYGETGAGASHRWILDPIDGTRSFIRGVPLYGVMLGLEREGQPVLGVVNIPALGELVYAAAGLGCFWNGRPCRVSATSTLADSLVLGTVANHPDAKGAALARLAAAAGMFRTWGDCYGYVLVATGRAEVMLDPLMNAWDCAAVLPIIQEAGGIFTDWDGTITIHGGDAIATNGVLHDAVMAVVEQ